MFVGDSVFVGVFDWVSRNFSYLPSEQDAEAHYVVA